MTFWLSVGESLAQSKLSFLLDKNPKCLQEAGIIFHCFSSILRILKGKQYNDRLRSLYNPANLKINAAKMSEKSDIGLV